MKYVPLIIATVMFGGASVVLCIAMLAPADLQRTLIVDPHERHLGTVEPGIVKCDFTLTNGLPYEIELISIGRSCACTTATVNKHRLKRNDKASLTATIDFRGRSGEVSSHLTVTYRRAGEKTDKSSTAVCLVYANVNSTVNLSATSLSFDAHTRGVQQLRLDIAGDVCHVAEVSVTHRAFTVSTSADMKQISVAFDPTLFEEHSGTPKLVIRTTCAFEDRITVPLQVEN